MINPYDLAIMPAGSCLCMEAHWVIAATRGSPEGYEPLWQKSFRQVGIVEQARQQLTRAGVRQEQKTWKLDIVPQEGEEKLLVEPRQARGQPLINRIERRHVPHIDTDCEWLEALYKLSKQGLSLGHVPLHPF